MRITGKIFAILAFLLLTNSCQNNFGQLNSQTATTNSNQIQRNKNLNIPTPISSKLSQVDSKIIQKKIKVAALLPLSGKGKDLGTAILNSVTLSLFENDKNNDIELVVFDSSDIKKSLEKIIAANIKIIVGPIFSSDVEAIASEAQINKITILSFSNNQDLAGKKGIFLMGFLPEQQIERISGYAISAGRDDFAVIAPNNQYGKKFASILQDMAKRKDGNFISSAFYSNSNKDLEKAVAKVLSAYISVSGKNNKNKAGEKIYANTIAIPESGLALSKIVALINKYNKTEQQIQIIGSSNWDDISTLNDPNLIGGWFVSSDPEKYRDFEKRYYQIYNKFPPRISSIGYDAISAIIETIRKSSRREISANDLINYQSSKNGFVGIDGLFRFLPNGIVQRNFAILEIKNGKFEMIDSPSSMLFKY